MCETIRMTKEQAIKYYNSSSDNGFKELLEDKFGKDFAKPKNIIDVVYDIDTLESYLGYEFEIPYPSSVKDKLKRSINALYILSKVAEIYNEGTSLDWNNTSIYKYLPYKYFSSSFGSGVTASRIWRYDLHAPACLYYKSPKLSEASYKNFKKYWEDYWQQ